MATEQEKHEYKATASEAIDSLLLTLTKEGGVNLPDACVTAFASIIRFALLHGTSQGRVTVFYAMALAAIESAYDIDPEAFATTTPTFGGASIDVETEEPASSEDEKEVN